MIAHSSTLPPIADEPASPLRDELMDLCTSLQRQQSDLVSKFEAQEVEITMLKARVKLLEDGEGGGTDRSGDDASIKGRRLDKGEEADEKEWFYPVGPPSFEVLTSSDVVPTAGPIFATAIVVTSYTRRKGKEKMIERIELISDLVRYQDNYAKVHKYQTLQRKPRSKKQKKDYYMAVIKGHVGWKIKDFKGLSFEQIEAKFNTVWKQIKEFIPIGSKEETERFKRKGLRLEQVSEKKLKTSKEVHEEVKATEEVPEDKHLDREDLNQLWALVKESLNIRPALSDKEMELWVELKRLYEPDVKNQLWTHTQNMMHAPVEWKLYDSCGVHHVISKYNEIFMLIEKDYPLRKGLAIVMISYKLQVENYSQMASDLILKIYKIERIVGNNMHKAFPLPVIELPLAEEVPTASEESSHCQKKRDATAEKITLLLKSSSN
nr:hypothetical protein [Tanacetum cinerariifolium]